MEKYDEERPMLSDHVPKVPSSPRRQTTHTLMPHSKHMPTVSKELGKAKTMVERPRHGAPAEGPPPYKPGGMGNGHPTNICPQ